MRNYEVGDIVVCTVSGFSPYGIFVNVDREYTGLIHISEISYSYVKKVEDYAKFKEMIRVEVIGVDDVNKKLKLSIKDIDYKIVKNNYNKIIETPLGFTTLRKNLPYWTKTKKQELRNLKKI